MKSSNFYDNFDNEKKDNRDKNRLLFIYKYGVKITIKVIEVFSGQE